MAEEKKKKTPADFKRESRESFLAPPAPGAKIGKVVGVVSGKGGVGKSLVTSLCACVLKQAGYRVGILDADITGPSIPRMFGVEGLSYVTEQLMGPGVSTGGIKVMSLNLLMDHDTDPVIWRGPVIAGVVKQFWSEADWGELDVMMVDMPPGTGDVPLTVFQSLPVDGILIVTTPQELVSMIVEKAENMAQMMEIPVLGVVENMAYMTCPHCGEMIDIFGTQGHDAAAQCAASRGLDLLAKLPIDPGLAGLCDTGRIEEADLQALALESLTARLQSLLGGTPEV